MLAIARCLMGQPRLVMLDEPSLGLAPVVAEDVMRTIRGLNERDRLTVLLVEQNVAQSLTLAASRLCARERPHRAERDGRGAAGQRRRAARLYRALAGSRLTTLP